MERLEEEHKEQLSQLEARLKEEREVLAKERKEMAEEREDLAEEREEMAVEKEKIKAEREQMVAEKEKFKIGLDRRKVLAEGATDAGAARKREHYTIHMEVKGNRIGRRHVEMDDLEKTIHCYADPNNGTNCAHVQVRGFDTHVKVRNVKCDAPKVSLLSMKLFESPRKLKCYFTLTAAGDRK